jgi:hypothetical protein
MGIIHDLFIHRWVDFDQVEKCAAMPKITVYFQFD